MNESELNNLFDAIDNYIDSNSFIPTSIIMSPDLFNCLRKQAYYRFANLVTVEVLPKLNDYIIYTIKNLKDKYKRDDYRTKLIKELRRLNK